MLTYVETHRISPHPQNPRKDLGDLTELAESIKASGILQNLTLVPWRSKITGAPSDNHETDPMFTVVIGHRRLAAAKLAGLTELPCAIYDMDEKMQIATMLLENIQRSDLTPWEQAQGFQMMLDLGDSVGGISEKTGFSENTVRRRVKLLELDANKFKASEARGGTLQDYAELDKIADPKLRNSVLDKIGTENFNYELKKAIDKEAQAARTAAWIEALSAFATQVDSTTGYIQVKYYYTSNKPNVERPDDADSVDYCFHVNQYGCIYLLKKSDAPVQSADPEAERRKESLERRKAGLKEATERAYALRMEFVRSVSATRIKKNLADIVAFAVWNAIDGWGIDDELVLEMLGVEIDDEGEDEDLTFEAVHEAVSKTPERALLMMVYCKAGDRKSEGYYQYWNAKHQKNENLDMLYALLEKLGYKLSDEERALMDGTHELFGENPELEVADEPEDPCALCKSAHPSCDKCCRVCEDRCNAGQRCYKQVEDEAGL